MIDPEHFVNKLKSHQLNFFAGVPDSLLSSFCAFIDDNKSIEHVITANEGNAVSLAMGYHFATNKFGVVYMQNSGLGNIVNPITSLVDKKVYKIPMLMIIGWRGEPNIKDEPQHIKQGEITLEQLDLLEIPYLIMDKNSHSDDLINQAVELIKKLNTPVAIIVKKDTFSKYSTTKIFPPLSNFSRECALSLILDNCSEDDLVVATTGKTSRELYELREKRQEKNADFLTVGGMGHASSIALGVSMGCKSKKVICIDGDGAFLMHMGAAAISGFSKQKNFIHILLNNGMHESVGGQPTVASNLDISKIAIACGYSSYSCITTESELEKLTNMLGSDANGPSFIEIKIKGGSRKDLGRPKVSALENKISFMDKIKGN
jgi:phosphonopyruvate decarboxylase